MSYLCPTGEYCHACSRVIEWDGHTRESHLALELRCAEAVLRTIADMDYRGNMPPEQALARNYFEAKNELHTNQPKGSE